MVCLPPADRIRSDLRVTRCHLELFGVRDRPLCRPAVGARITAEYWFTALTLDLAPGFTLWGMAHALQIGKAAMLAGVSVDTIRFYQELGLIEGANRTESGYRLFDQDQLHDRKFVRHAQELGFSLAEVKELLSLRQKSHACAEVQSMLTGKLSDVRNKIKSLARLEAELQGTLRACNRELRLERGIKHDDCCPLLKKLDRSDDARKRQQSGSSPKKR